MIQVDEHIISNSKILMGKPVIKGTRISVEMLLEKLAVGETKEHILEAHPHITSDDIEAAILFSQKI